VFTSTFNIGNAGGSFLCGIALSASLGLRDPALTGLDHTRTAIAYYQGRYEPPNAAVRGSMMVPYDQRSRAACDLQRRLHL
jgi:hypothetical protein